jgi:hydrogenase maturation factor HypF (carbamoyltransferase family)
MILKLFNGEIQYIRFLESCIKDFQSSGDVSKICRKVLFSLARLVGLLSDHFKIEKIAFSGGVFSKRFVGGYDQKNCCMVKRSCISIFN